MKPMMMVDGDGDEADDQEKRRRGKAICRGEEFTQGRAKMLLFLSPHPYFNNKNF